MIIVIYILGAIYAACAAVCAFIAGLCLLGCLARWLFPDRDQAHPGDRASYIDASAFPDVEWLMTWDDIEALPVIDR